LLLSCRGGTFARIAPRDGEHQTRSGQEDILDGGDEAVALSVVRRRAYRGGVERSLWVSHKLLLAGLHPNQFLLAPPWKLGVVTLCGGPKSFGSSRWAFYLQKGRISKWRDPDSKRGHHDFQVFPRNLWFTAISRRGPNLSDFWRSPTGVSRYQTP
jgi:hypothetical protein